MNDQLAKEETYDQRNLCLDSHNLLRPLPQLLGPLLIKTHPIPRIPLPNRLPKRHTSPLHFLPHILPRRRPQRIIAPLIGRHQAHRVRHPHQRALPKRQPRDELRLDHARVDGQAGDARDAPVEFLREDDVGELALAVAAPGAQADVLLRCAQRGEVDPVGRMPRIALARQRDEAHIRPRRLRRPAHHGQQPQQQRRIADMVRPKLHLEPILRHARLDGHDARIRHKHIQSILGELVRGGAHALERGEVAGQERGFHGGGDEGEDGVGGGLVAAGEEDVGGVVFGEVEDGGFADAAGSWGVLV